MNIEQLKESIQTLDFENPAEFLAFYHPEINKARLILHPWQLKISELIGSAKPTAANPLEINVCAANGSGKDAFVIASTAVWFCVTRKKGLVKGTSSSSNQLTTQTEKHIRNLAGYVNAFHGCEIFDIKQRHIKCNLTGSEIELFVTDEPGKAEGSHPIDDNDMMIICNEAKSIPDDIFQALTRCTGYNYWLNVSSPGEPKGYFYHVCNTWKHTFHVTAFDCPHISNHTIEKAKSDWGEHSAIYRSMILAEFTSVGGSVVVTQEAINRCIKNCKPLGETWPLRIGIDLALGGDETVICVMRGNTRVFQHTFYEENSLLCANRITQYLKHTLKLPLTHPHIYIDDGGVGRAIADMIAADGWELKRILNQSRAYNTKEFGNRGAELWFNVGKMIENSLLNLPSDDKKLLSQLASRHYKKNETSGKVVLQSKADAKAMGHPSPDRADAMVLALTGLRVKDFRPVSDDTNAIVPSGMTSEELYTQFQTNKSFRNLIGSTYDTSLRSSNRDKPVNASLTTALG